jgi:menaquinone-9 beta-reductase
MDRDALIIGAGPAGAMAAFLLARAGWKVAIIEKTQFPRRKVCGEFISAGTLSLLNSIGLGSELLNLAGPEVRNVGIFAGFAAICSAMPRYPDFPFWGRALSREHLDTMLLEAAKSAGAEVIQPATVSSLERNSHSWRCHFKEAQGTSALTAPVVIAAHGSWEPSPLPTFPSRKAHRLTDLFGFKAHLRNSRLPESLMPLLAFPGGYGGMVHTDDGRVSFSCCIQRQCLDRIRVPGKQAGEAVIDYIAGKCSHVREALAAAVPDGPTLSVGPIRPGIRQKSGHGIFLLGNAAGEAHPVVAEGISMAVQSAWLLCERLTSAGREIRNEAMLRDVSECFVADWTRNFSARIRLSGVVARLAMNRSAATILLPLFRTWPSLLTFGAERVGKVRAPLMSGPIFSGTRANAVAS